MHTRILRQKVKTAYREIKKAQVARDIGESILLVVTES